MSVLRSVFGSETVQSKSLFNLAFVLELFDFEQDLTCFV